MKDVEMAKSVTVKVGQDSYHINLFEPEQIRQLVPAFLGLYIIILLLIAFAPSHFSGWLLINLIIFIPYIAASIVIGLHSRKYIADFFLYMAFSTLIISLNFLALGLRLMSLFTLKSAIVVGLLYLGVLLTMFNLRIKLLLLETRNVKHGRYYKIAFPITASAIGASLGLTISRTLPDNFSALIGGFAFLSAAFLFESGIIQIFYKWLLLKRAGF